MGLGWEVTCLSLQSAGAGNSPGVRRVSADIADGAGLKVALGNAAFEYVVNCGGYIDHALFSRGGRKALEAHYDGVLNLAFRDEGTVEDCSVSIRSHHD